MSKKQEEGYRILIETSNKLYEGFIPMHGPGSTLIDVLQKKLFMHCISDYIIVTDLKNYKGAAISIHGNAEKIGQMFDALVHHMILNNKPVLERVMIAWEKRTGAAHER